MMDARSWLGDRLAAAPTDLSETMSAALAAVDVGQSVPDTLASAALTLYRSVLIGSGGREDALPLLAADALFTHAFEAQAETEPSRLVEFARRWGAGGRLAGVAE
ncbi:MAG: hypothetical protein WD737_11450 [Gemmatimonadota bacterium]